MTTTEDYKERYVHWNLKIYMYKQSHRTFQVFSQTKVKIVDWREVLLSVLAMLNTSYVTLF